MDKERHGTLIRMAGLAAGIIAATVAGQLPFMSGPAVVLNLLAIGLIGYFFVWVVKGRRWRW